MRIQLPPVADPVGEALHFFRVCGTFYCRSEFRAPWALAIPPIEDSLMLHVLTAGRCVLEVDGGPACVLHAGDLALVPHGRGHVLSSAPGLPAAPLFETSREQLSERFETLKLGGDGERAAMICGLFTFDDPAARQLVALLPKIISVETWTAPQADWIQSTLRMIAAEAQEMSLGGDAVITRLADILAIHAIRYWMTHDPAANTGWLAALRDPKIGGIIARVHREPARPWTLNSLAREASMSRSAFSARFTELVGETAMHYVARRRMYSAQARLQTGNATVSEVALSLGYESEAAFNRAFKRHIGISPGAAKRPRS
jgi:AraC-like DNA-binding protein